MQTAETRNISQKCKEKQDALERKDKQVRVLLSDFSWCLFLVFLSALLLAECQISMKMLQVLALFTPSSTQYIFRTLISQTGVTKREVYIA